MATVAAFEFLEIADDVRPVDDLGNVEDLPTTPGETTPAVVQGRYGRAREFGDAKSFLATDAVSNATLLNRDVTFFGWVDFKIDNFGNGDIGILVRREGSGPDELAFAVCLERVDANTVGLVMDWDGAVPATTSGVSFPHPGREFMVAVVRTWNSTTDVEVRYFIDGDLRAVETVAEGGIDPSSGGTLAVGSDGAGGDYLPDDSVIEFFQLEDDPIPDEEIRQMYRQVAVHQPSGYKILRAFLPSGEAWSRDPTSFVQRWIAAEGDALGLEIADIERFREDFLPDRAYGGALEDWERITGQVSNLSDTIAVRRARVIGFLRVVLGFQPEDLKTALEPTFGLDAVDIEIIEFDALKEDDFSVEDVIAAPSRMWLTRLGAGAIVVDTPTPECDVGFGFADCLYFKQAAAGAGGPIRETSISGRPGGDDVDGSMIILEIASAALALDLFAGVFMRTPSGDDAIFWGLTGAGEDLSYFDYSGGVMSAITVVIAAATTPQTLAIRYNGAGLYDLGRIAGGVFVVDVVDAPGPTSPRWAGFGCMERIATASSASASFRNAQVYEPQSSKAYTYLAIRNPALPGTFDIEAAQAQLDRQSPAHTIPIAATTDQGFELGPTGPGRLGSSPLFPVV